MKTLIKKRGIPEGWRELSEGTIKIQGDRWKRAEHRNNTNFSNIEEWKETCEFGRNRPTRAFDCLIYIRKNAN